MSGVKYWVPVMIATIVDEDEARREGETPQGWAQDQVLAELDRNGFEMASIGVRSERQFDQMVEFPRT